MSKAWIVITNYDVFVALTNNMHISKLFWPNIRSFSIALFVMAPRLLTTTGVCSAERSVHQNLTLCSFKTPFIQTCVHQKNQFLTNCQSSRLHVISSALQAVDKSPYEHQGGLEDFTACTDRKETIVRNEMYR